MSDKNFGQFAETVLFFWDIFCPKLKSSEYFMQVMYRERYESPFS